MADITCPITIIGQSVSISQVDNGRTVEVEVSPINRVVTAVISQGRKGDKGDPGAPGGVNAVSAGAVSTSGGTLVFGNSNGVSFGLTDGTLTASHNALTTAAGVSHIHGSPVLMLQDITGGVSSASDGLTIALTGPQQTYSQFVFSEGNGITFGTTGSTVTGSVSPGLTTAAQSDHSHGNPTLALTNMFGTASSASGGLSLSLSVNPFTGTATGGLADGYNIIGVNGNTAHSAATIQFSNSNNVSFGLAGSTVTASASYPEQTAFVLSESNGLSFGTSGSTVTASIPAQTEYVFSQGGGMTFGTSGSTVTASHDGAASSHSHGNPVLALTNISGSTASGSNGFTISLSGQDLPIDGGIALRAGTQTAQSGTVVFSNANGITFGMSGSSRVTASHDALTTAALSDHSHGLSFSATGASFTTSADSNGQTVLLSVSPATNTTLYYSAANGSASIGTLKFADSNGVSFSTGTQGLFASVRTNYAETSAVVLTSQSSLFQHTSATSAITSLAMHTSERGRYFYTSANTFANSTHNHGNISVAGLSATSASNGLTLSVSQTVQTQGSVQVGGSTGPITFANSNGITFGGNGSTITASHNALTTAALSNHSHGNPTLALTNLTGTTASNSAGLTLSLSAPATTAAVVMAAGAQTATSGTVVFSNANGISFGMSGSTRVTASHNALTTAAQSNHSHGNPVLALTNLTGTTASNSAGLTISLSAAAGGTGGGAAISAGTQSGNTGTIVFSNSNGITFGMSGNSRITASHNGLTTAMATSERANYFYTSANTFANSTHSHGNPTLNLTNISGTTASGSNGLTLSLSAGSGGAGVAIQNSETTYTSGTVNFSAGGGAMTIASGTGQRLIFSVPQTSQIVGANITISSSGSTITLSAPTPLAMETAYIPYYPASTGAQTLGNTGTSTASAWFFPISVVVPVVFNRIEQLMTCSFITSTISGQQTITEAFGLYSNNAGTLSLISSNSFTLRLTNSSVSATLSYPTSYGTAGGYGYGETQATTTAQAHSLFGTAGNRIVTLGFGNTMSLDAGMYWIGFHQRMSSSSANVGLVPALAGNVMQAAQNAGPIGSYTISYSTGTDAMKFKWGWGAATSTGSTNYDGTNVPAAYPISAIVHTATVMPMMTFISR